MNQGQPKNRDSKDSIAILGGGNIGQAIAAGLTRAGAYKPSQIWMTRRQTDRLAEFARQGYQITTDNTAAVQQCKIVLIAVQPGQMVGLLDSIRGELRQDSHLILSTVTGVLIADIDRHLDGDYPVIRVMPNTAVAIGQSMTCLAASENHQQELAQVVSLFDKLGSTLVIDEEHMVSATALCACGIAFFLRSIRAASQGGIQIGFPPDDALKMAAQTACGAAQLVLESGVHPEAEIDRVTTPRGCTIAGLNRMEHEGFSSALIKGFVTASDIAASLFSNNTLPPSTEQ